MYLFRISFAGLVVLAVVRLWTGPVLVADPFLGLRGYALYVAALAVVFAVVVLGRRLEKARVRRAILERLGLPAGEEGCRAARERILGLVRCRRVRLRGRLAELPSGRGVWLCFLPRQLLAVSARTGAVVALPQEELQAVHVSEGARPGEFSVTLQTREGPSVLAVSRLADAVRVVNILTRQGAAVGVPDSGSRPVGAARAVGWAVALAVVAVLLPNALALLPGTWPKQRQCVRTLALDDPQVPAAGAAVASAEKPLAVKSKEKDVFEGSKTKTVWLLTVWNESTGREVCTVTSDVFPGTVVLSPDGKRLAAASWGGEVRVWDVAPAPLWEASNDWRKQAFALPAGDARDELDRGHAPRLAFSRDGKQLFVAAGDRVTVWE